MNISFFVWNLALSSGDTETSHKLHVKLMVDYVGEVGIVHAFSSLHLSSTKCSALLVQMWVPSMHVSVKLYEGYQANLYLNFSNSLFRLNNGWLQSKD